MATTKNFIVNKGIPYLATCSAEGKHISGSVTSFETEGETHGYQMHNYTGLVDEYLYGVVSAGKVDFFGTLLPQDWVMSTLQKSKYCFMPIGTDYQNVKNYAFDIDVIGSLTIDKEHGKVSGFSASNYLRLPNTFYPENNSWEIVIKFKPYSIHDGTIMTKMSAAPYYGLRIDIVNDGHIYYIISDSQYSATPFEGEGSGSYVVNSWNWVKVEFTGSVYNSYLSTDGTNWTLDKTVTSSRKFYSYTANTNIGGNPDNSQFSYIDGEIDLSGSHIDIGGSRWWSGGRVITETLSGCTYNYTDDGSAVTLNAFVVNGDESIVLTPDNSYTNGRLLGTVNIPAHTAYNYRTFPTIRWSLM